MQFSLYQIATLTIVGVLALAMIVAFEGGFHTGKRISREVTDNARSQITAVQAATFTVVGLLLGFAFSESLQRHDERNTAVVDEANAIGTAWLRSGLLTAPYRDEAQALFREYAALRAEAGGVSMVDDEKRAARYREAGALQNAIWDVGARALVESPDSAIARIYVQSVNEMIDSYGRRRATLDRHLPQFAVMMLLGGFVLVAATLGFGSGVSGHRAAVTTIGLLVIVSLVVFIVLDLDRPRRGLIAERQTSLIELRDAIEAGG